MKISGIKRGLAVSAVSALAVVGLPFTAHADTINNQVDATFGDREVVLLSQSDNVATVKSDGVDSKVRLQASGTTDINVVRFGYRVSGSGDPWTQIDGLVTRNDNGTFMMEWDASGLVGSTVDIGVWGHSVIDDNYHVDIQSNVVVQGAGGAANAVNLADGEEIGVYNDFDDNELIIVKGKASAGGTTVEQVDGDGTVLNSTPTVFSGGNFLGVIDIDGPAYNYNDPDEIVLRAVNGSDDVESYDLYKQVITDMTVVPDDALPPTPTTPTDVTVTVLDQKGKPIAGANVVRIEDGIPNVGGAQYTDANGEVEFQQRVNDGTVTYLVNAVPEGGFVDFLATIGAYQPELGDIKKELTLGAAHAASLRANSVDGPAFDFDEYNAPGDISVQVKDQAGVDFDVPSGQDVTYEWKITPFDPSVEPATTPAKTQGIEVAGGKFNIEFPTVDPVDWVWAPVSWAGLGWPSGTYELYASLSEGGTGHPVAKTRVGTYKVGEAAVVYEGADPTLAPAGTIAEVKASIELEDGTGLAGRRADLTFLNGQEFDEDGNTTQPDALIVSADPATADGNGKFTIKVEDLAETELRAEIGGRIDADSVNLPGIGDWDDDNFRHGVDFYTDQLPAGAKVIVTYDNDTAGPAGTVEDVDIHVEDAFGDSLRGVKLNLSLDHGFFVDDDNGNGGMKAPVAGDFVPTPESLGDEISVVTNSSGNADADTSIGRDAGFDDDGKVTAKVTAAADGISGNDSIVWDSSDPLNAGSVELVLTPGQGDVDPASTGQGVEYDIYATDQFGNPAKGVEVDVDCAVELGDDDPCPTGVGDPFPWVGLESDFDNGGDIVLYSDEAGSFTYTATADAQKYDGSLNAVDADASDQVVQNWYAAAPTSFALSVSPAGNIPVGDIAIVTATVLDQEGNPFPGLQVDFVRTGDPNEIRFETNENGQASYTFNRTTAGTETVTAVVRTDDNNQSVILKTLTTKVSFGTAPFGGVIQAPVKASLKLVNTTRGHDVVKVTTGNKNAKGAKVTVYKIVRGKLRAVATTTLDANGAATKVIADGKKKKRSTYVVKVSQTAKTKAATSNRARIK